MFVEPTQSDLKAAAGWTLVKRQSVPDAHANALDKFRDGCEALMPHQATGAADSPVSTLEVKLPQLQAPPPRSSEIVAAPAESPPREFAALAGVVRCQDGGAHKFNIHTQRCVFCDQTRRQALSRDPELMVP